MLSKMSNYCVKGDYDLSLSLYADKNSGIPSCTHRINGSMKHSLLYLAGLGAVAALAASLAVCIGHTCCSLMCARR